MKSLLNTSGGRRLNRGALLGDLRASLVVFLVALPLCVGVAVASGVSAELGIITGIVGGVVAGAMPGSSMQVSGPAAGLTVLVAEAVHGYGIAALGVITLGVGAVQIMLGLLRLGRWFRAISPSVVRGMLAGIGLVLILGQLYPLLGATAAVSTADKVAGLPGTLAAAGSTPRGTVSAALGLATLVLLLCWERMPAKVRAVPGPLVAVTFAAAGTWVFRLPVATVKVGALFDALDIPDGASLVRLADVALLGTTLTIAVIATAESLFSAAAVDRMHDGPGTRYDAELLAQGAGNLSAGALGAPPMTAVIVRSSANVRAGARTRLSPVLHGVWLLVFAASLPDLLGIIPIPALAVLLLHAGWKLLDPAGLARAVRADRAEGAIALVTASLIASSDLLTGVLVGFVLSVARTAWRLSHVEVRWTGTDEEILVRIAGHATFLRLPQVLADLDRVPPSMRLRMDLSGLHHLDEAARNALDAWAADRRRAHGAVLAVPSPDAAVNG